MVLPSFESVTVQFLVAIQRLAVVQQQVLSVVVRLARELQHLAHTGLGQRLVVEVHMDRWGEVSFAAQLGQQD